MALVSQEVGGTPFLREGVVPEVGMMLYLQVGLAPTRVQLFIKPRLSMFLWLTQQLAGLLCSSKGSIHRRT